ncbi:MAG: hypothetical protein ACTHMS_09360 [Jatrophihabitans sp.]|uniref:L,D-transpeptidase family protein n=1 Tax=Jatrophihabitans sp. TaxID=1932789 RepID=UPI003F7E68C9
MRARLVRTVALAALTVSGAAACTTSSSTAVGPAPTSSQVAGTTASASASVPALSASVSASVSASPADPPVRHTASRLPRAPRTGSTSPVRTPSPTASPTPSAPPRRPTPAAAHGSALPLRYPTGDAGQVITVVAAGERSTTALLQRWTRVAGGWRAVGPQVPAEVGSAGLSAHPSESVSATPEGSFTLTQAFGRDPDPGTALPYTQTTPDDWWISESGPLYNTFQRCASGCPFTQGDPNEHLYFTTPFYDEAVVIDYNTRNSPTGVRQGAGSAFFLHVSVGEPTAGCVAIAQPALLEVLRWLRPADHPRILIGTGR